MYDLPTEEITKSVLAFKEQNKIHSNSSSLKSGNSQKIAIDSSLFIIEAALNYDFDETSSNSEVIHDSCSFEINHANGDVLTSDLIQAYNYFSQYINSKTNILTQVKIIDITAQFINNKIRYIADINLFIKSGQKFIDFCAPYDNSYTANWSNSIMSTYSCYTGGNDGPNSCAFKLNCDIPIGSCPGFYWANVVTVKLGDYGNVWSGLYYSPNKPSVCYEPLLYGGDINNKVLLCKSYANSYLPSSPAGMHIAGYGVFGRVMPGSYYATLTMWWGLNITYGTYGCGSLPN